MVNHTDCYGGIQINLLNVRLHQTPDKKAQVFPVGNLNGGIREFLNAGYYRLKTDSLVITGLIGVLALLVSIAIAFIVGLGAAYLLAWIKKEARKERSCNPGPGNTGHHHGLIFRRNRALTTKP
jgi:hypothetical protein